MILFIIPSSLMGCIVIIFTLISLFFAGYHHIPDLIIIFQLLNENKCPIQSIIEFLLWIPVDGLWIGNQDCYFDNTCF